MTDLFPEVRDRSTLTGVFRADQLLPIGVEGQMAATGTTATLGLPVTVTTAEQAATLFGVSSLTTLIQFILARGAPSVRAVASDDAPPLLATRQAAWKPLEEDPSIRIRLTDSDVQADLVALADSCEWAEGIQHKQFMFGALATPTVKANLITAADAIASKRGVLIGPGVYDGDGVLRGGALAAAMAAVEVSRNPDIADSLNLAPISATSGIELETATGLPLFRLRANAGVPANDHAELLAEGVSTFMLGPDGRAAFSHLRLTYTVDDTFDSLMTLLIKDEVFLGIKAKLLAGKYHRRPNNESNRNLAATEVDNWLKAHSDWVEPVELPNGDNGYGVTVEPAVDLKSFTVSYFGNVVRGTNVINVNGTLTIPVGQ